MDNFERNNKPGSTGSFFMPWLLGFVGVLGIGSLYLFLDKKDQDMASELIEETAQTSQGIERQAEPEPEKPKSPFARKIQKVEKPVETVPALEGQSRGDEVIVPSLPILNESDEEIFKELTSLTWVEDFPNWLRKDDIARRFVVSVENIANNKLPEKHLPLKRPPQLFMALEKDGKTWISPKNFDRYTVYSDIFSTIDFDKTVKVYTHYFPLLETAYSELGLHGFHQKLLDAIDVLIDTPVVDGPLEIKSKGAIYLFADPELEKLPGPQKQLIRMGPDNSDRIIKQLKKLREALN